MKKYKLIKTKTTTLFGKTLYRIVALRDGRWFKKDEIGGWVSGEHNLSQEGDCWVGKEAKVFDNATITDNARVLDEAMVCHTAEISGEAVLHGKASVVGATKVSERARVFGSAVVYKKAKVLGDAAVFGDANVRGRAMIAGNATVFGNAIVGGKAKVLGSATVADSSMVSGRARVLGTAKVGSTARIFGDDIVTKSPIVFDLRADGIITVTDNNINIGEEQHTLEQWLKNHKSIMKTACYSKRKRAVYLAILKAIKDISKL